MQTECLLLGDAGTHVEIRARFLRSENSAKPQGEVLRTLGISAREVATPCLNLHELVRSPYRQEFAFPCGEPSPVRGRSVHSEDGRLSLRERTFFRGAKDDTILGNVEVSAEQLGNAFRLRVRLQNVTPLEGADLLTREEALAWSLLSCHLLLGAEGGEFVSLLDPPVPFRESAAACKQLGLWPVLAGDESRRATMLAAPIILYDYPRIAPQSPGDLFDATEMDEMLTLRIRTLADEEKQAMALTDPQAERILSRCDNMSSEELRRLHGVWRNEESSLTPGMRVRLRPQGRADAFDLALAGMTAVIVAIERDFDDRIHVSVAVDEDPGRDLGLAGKPGHRFYFRPDEVEPLHEPQGSEYLTLGLAPILIAGIGNIFFGDDAFGVEVVRRLAERPVPAGVVVKDFGIRGFDLACALQEGYHAAILVDAVQRGSPPGTLHVLEIDAESNEPAANLDMHRLDPVQVLGLARHMGGRLPLLRLVGCEPALLEPGGAEIVNLSEAVRCMVPHAVELVCALAEEMRAIAHQPEAQARATAHQPEAQARATAHQPEAQARATI